MNPLAIGMTLRILIGAAATLMGFGLVVVGTFSLDPAIAAAGAAAMYVGRKG